MLAHPSIERVAVVGVPDERLGEVGAAFIVPAAGTKPDGEELMAWCRAEMANYKAPRLVKVVDDLPMNASGKVLKFELRERATALRATCSSGGNHKLEQKLSHGPEGVEPSR